MLHLKDCQIKLIRMKYSETFSSLREFEKKFLSTFVAPVKDILTGSVHPILEDLIQIDDNCEESGADQQSTKIQIYSVFKLHKD